MSDVSRAGGAAVLAVNGRMPRRRESGLFLDMLRWCNLDLQRDLGRASLPPEGGWEMVRMLNMIGRAILEKAKDQRSRLRRLEQQAKDVGFGQETSRPARPGRLPMDLEESIVIDILADRISQAEA